MPDLPIKSYHCTTTHSACDCVLERLKKLEKAHDTLVDICRITAGCDLEIEMNLEVFKIMRAYFETLRKMEKE